jgi:hypothetical protein
VLKRTQKGQNTAMAAEEAVRIVNSYGMVVKHRPHPGFDGERKGIAESMLKMVQTTVAFPTLVLALHALPRSELHRRMAAEGRLFAGGIEMATTATAPTRDDRAELRDRAPRARCSRTSPTCWRALPAAQPLRAVEKTVRQLGRVNRSSRRGKMIPRLARSFLRIVSTLGRDPETGPLF